MRVLLQLTAIVVALSATLPLLSMLPTLAERGDYDLMGMALVFMLCITIMAVCTIMLLIPRTKS